MLKQNIFGWSGIALGGLALLLAMVHFYAGPFAPQQTLESLVAGKAVAIKESLLASLAGHQIPEKVSRPHYDVDRILKIVTAVLAVGAVVLGAIARACKENPRAVSAAVMLGIGTLAFQIAMFAFGVVMAIFLIFLVLSLIFGVGAVC
ncbi:hypothetical protein [Serratia fonticola]|jgi:hypothetical protein|uniref:hypothetical protein n=1 Tax=Serratia fonticola TaxID=47917 RepID=UPI000939862F|nr:hypothetical protein [Serratia fonticola]OKP26245.1 hypothetical protein BSQ40_19890 [Serratia fonticola]